MNDIEILQEMLIADAIVPLQHGQTTSVELTDPQGNTTVTIKLKGSLLTQLLSEPKSLRPLVISLTMYRTYINGRIS